MDACLGAVFYLRLSFCKKEAVGVESGSSFLSAHAQSPAELGFTQVQFSEKAGSYVIRRFELAPRRRRQVLMRRRSPTQREAMDRHTGRGNRACPSVVSTTYERTVNGFSNLRFER